MAAQHWFETADERRWVRALSIAAAAHLALLVVLFLVVFESTPDRAARLDSSWATSESVEFDALTPVAPLVVAATPSAGGRAARSTWSEVEPTPAVIASPLRPSARGRLPVGTASSGESLLAAAPARTDGDADDGAGRGDGIGDGNGDGSGQGFFGIGTPGRTFVYVVDASSSMLALHDSPAKTRFGRVRVELVKSIGAMTPEQGFFVIFFNSTSHPMPARGMQPGVAPTKRAYLDWVAKHRPGGDTQPMDSLELAIALRPDVVYFLTDGVLPRGQNLLRRITGLNGGRTRIHTFAFGSQNGEEVLQEIARRNGGEYKFVP